MSNGLLAPHGGALITPMEGESERATLQERAFSLSQVEVGSRKLADLEMLAIGAYSQLRGFMTKADYLGSFNDMHLASGFPWSVPITLSTTSEQAATLKEGSQIALVNAQGTLQAVMTLEEKFDYDKQLEASKVYRTTDDAHPGVKVVYEQGDVLLGGPVRIVALQH